MTNSSNTFWWNGCQSKCTDSTPTTCTYHTSRSKTGACPTSSYSTTSLKSWRTRPTRNTSTPPASKKRSPSSTSPYPHALTQTWSWDCPNPLPWPVWQYWTNWTLNPRSWALTNPCWTWSSRHFRLKSSWMRKTCTYTGVIVWWTSIPTRNTWARAILRHICTDTVVVWWRMRAWLICPCSRIWKRGSLTRIWPISIQGAMRLKSGARRNYQTARAYTTWFWSYRIKSWSRITQKSIKCKLRMWVWRLFRH